MRRTYPAYVFGAVLLCVLTTLGAGVRKARADQESPQPDGASSAGTQQTVRLTVVDGYNQKTQKTLVQEGTVSVVNKSDNVWLQTLSGYYVSFTFSDISALPGSTLNSVIVYVEHYEDSGFRTGKLQWNVGTGWPSTPVVWGTKTNVPVRASRSREGVDSWDVTSLVNTFDKVNSMELQIKNNDASKTTRTDYVYADVKYTPNQPPVANAGPDQTLSDADGSGSETATLDGSASYDPDGAIVGYEWKEGATALGTTATITPSLSVGTHTITLTATDNGGATSTDTVIVTVSPNQRPTANAGPDQTVTDTDGNGTEAVTLDGSASNDPDGTIMSYEWKEGETAIGATATITSSFAVGTHTVTLTVTDNGGAAATDDVTVRVQAPPPAMCGNGVCEPGESAATCSLDCQSSHIASGPFWLGASLVRSDSLDYFTQANAKPVWPSLAVEWKRVEVAEDVFDFSYYDGLFQPYYAAGTELIGRIVTGSCWAKVEWGPYCGGYQARPYAMPKDLLDFHTFVYATVDHYKGKVHYWQLIDEPATAFKGTKEQMVALQREFYLAAKEADASVAVLPGSFPGTIVMGVVLTDLVNQGKTSEALELYQRIYVESKPRDYGPLTEQELIDYLNAEPQRTYIELTAYFLDNANAYFDLFSLHDYRNFDNIASFEEMLERVKPRVNKPMVTLTGVGADPGVTYADQAERVPKRTVIAWGEGFGMALWWSFVDMPQGSDPINVRSGLIRNDLTPKPGYYTFKLLGLKMQGVTSIEKLPLEGAYAYKLKRLDGSFSLLLWHETETRTIDLTGHIAGDDVLVTHIITQTGQTEPVTETVPSTSVTISPQPVFVDPC